MLLYVVFGLIFIAFYYAIALVFGRKITQKKRKISYIFNEKKDGGTVTIVGNANLTPESFEESLKENKLNPPTPIHPTIKDGEPPKEKSEQQTHEQSVDARSQAAPAEQTVSAPFLALQVNKCPNFSTILPSSFAHLTNITKLMLDGNSITHLPESINLCAKLEKLNLQNNKLRTLPKTLSELFEKNLTYLNVQENYLALDELDESLKKRHPKVTKVWNNQHIAQFIFPSPFGTVSPSSPSTPSSPSSPPSSSSAPSSPLAINGVYLGSALSAKNKEFLVQNNITHVLIVNHMEPFYPEEFKYKVVREEDQNSSNLLQHFHSCIEFLDEAMKQGTNALVHCAAGVSRSASIVIAYAMFHRKLSFEACYALVKERRCCIAPNEGFERQLQIFHLTDYQFEGAVYEQFILQQIALQKQMFQRIEEGQTSSTENSNVHDKRSGSHKHKHGLNLENLEELFYLSEISKRKHKSEQAPFPQLCLNYLKMKSLPAQLVENNWKVLNLRENMLSESAFASFSAGSLASMASSLTKLILSNNQLAQIPIDFLKHLPNLTHLDISYNQISEIPAELFSSCKQISEFHIAKNNLQVIPDEIAQWKELRILDCAMNQIKLLPSLQVMKELKQLKKVHVAHNKLKALAGRPIEEYIAQLKKEVSNPTLQLTFLEISQTL